MSRLIRTPGHLLLCVAALVLAGCSTLAPPPVETQSDPARDLSQYRTYAWLSEAPFVPAGAFKSTSTRGIDKRIRAIADHELRQKGLRLAVAGENAELLVTYHARTKDRISLATWGISYGFGRDAGFPTLSAHSKQDSPGSLVIDLIDASTRDLVWRGTVMDAIDQLDRPQDQLEVAVSEAVSAYPSRAQPGG